MRSDYRLIPNDFSAETTGHQKTVSWWKLRANDDVLVTVAWGYLDKLWRFAGRRNAIRELLTLIRKGQQSQTLTERWADQPAISREAQLLYVTLTYVWFFNVVSESWRILVNAVVARDRVHYLCTLTILTLWTAISDYYNLHKNEKFSFLKYHCNIFLKSDGYGIISKFRVACVNDTSLTVCEERGIFTLTPLLFCRGIHWLSRRSTSRWNSRSLSRLSLASRIATSASQTSLEFTCNSTLPVEKLPFSTALLRRLWALLGCGSLCKPRRWPICPTAKE